MAHFDMKLVKNFAGMEYANVSYGGASLEESIDEFRYLYQKYPYIKNVVFGVSFYTLNNNYRLTNRMKTLETQLSNPSAYVFNFQYTKDTLMNFKNIITNQTDTEETAEHTPDEYIDESGNKLPFRKNLMAYAETITPVCTNYSINEKALEKLLELVEFCKENDVNLTIVFPPMDESVRKLVCDKNGIDTAMAPVMQTLKNSATVLDYEWENDPAYPDTFYFDGFHLDERHGLPVFTETLFSEVK